MKEIVVISGKGGTGKTSVAASLAHLNKTNMVVADCDVDAADLHLILTPDVLEQHTFRSGHKAHIRQNDCVACGKCASLCRYGAVAVSSAEPAIFCVDPISCEGCGVCAHFCPSKAIDFSEEVCGEYYVSETRFGPMVHAKLGVAAENSGKLVTLVRNEAKKLAFQKDAAYLIIDGSPGIGCPVIASLTASDHALIVTEPTVSGDHDLRRIATLTRRLGVKASVCVNKYDINCAATEKIKQYAQSAGLHFAGVIRYDKVITEAQRSCKAVTEFSSEGAAADIKNIWLSLEKALNN